MCRNKNLFRSFFAVLSLIIVCCKSNHISSKQELLMYIDDPSNNLRKTEMIKGVEVRLTYHPWQLMAGKLLHTRKNDSIETGKDLENLKGRIFFILSFSKDNKELLSQLDYNTYSEMVQVLSFRMIPQITLQQENKEAIQPQDCVFEQTYGMTGSNNLLLVFEKSAIQDGQKLKVLVKEFGLGLGDLSFEFNTSDINTISNIDYKQL